MGDEEIKGLSKKLGDRLIESLADQIVTKSDLQGVVEKLGELEKRFGQLEEAVKGSNSGAIARPAIPPWPKWSRWAQGAALVVACALSLSALGVVLLLLQLAGVPVGELLASLSK